MTRTVDRPISQLLPARLMHYRAKEATIKYLAACDLEPATRRRCFRAWCKATMTSCLRDDLARVALGKPRERNGELFPS